MPVEDENEEVEEVEGENEEVEGENEEVDEDAEFDPKNFTAEDIKKMKNALKQANKEAKTSREALKKAKIAQETEEEAKVREAVEEAENKITSAFVSRLAKSEATSAFKDAGFSGDPARFLKLLDMSEVSLDDDGDIVGLEDQITAIKADFPEVFTKEKKRTAPKGDGANKPPAGQGPKSSAERLAASLNK